MSQVWDQVKKAYHTIPAVWRDVVIALLVIMVIMGGLWVYTGQPVDQAPLVVVESGSMMHEDPPYGRLGTIDPGDLILVKDEDDLPNGVVTMYGALNDQPGTHPGEGDRSGYGNPGDVVIYRQDQCPGGNPTPIIHRAITWVEVERVGGQKVFSYHDASGQWRSRQNDVHLPEVQLSHNTDFDHSGWVTKGDNPETNRPADQNQICEGTLIKPEWLVGKARGEIPWIGLLKFIIQGNNWQVSDGNGVCTVVYARAPCDTFVMLWATLGVLILVPLVWDLVLRAKRRREDDEGPPPHRPHAAVPPPAAPPHHHGPRRPPPARPPGPPRGGTAPARPKPRWAQAAEEESRESDKER